MSDGNFFSKLIAASENNESLLCVGLDPTPQNIPQTYRGNNEPIVQSLLRWNQAILEATHDLACTYKPNIAFYEALGAPGMELLRETLALIPPQSPVLLDAKRNDIGSTAQAYAQACFDVWQVDAVTLNPYLGKDSLQPFLDYPDKGLFVLCHTSNPGAADFQELEISDWRALDREGNAPLYIHVARTATAWGPNVALVVGATYPDAIRAVREATPEPWFLVPGIGAQGGALEETIAAGLRADDMGLLINVGRGISLAESPQAAARQFRDDINRARASMKGSTHPATGSDDWKHAANQTATDSPATTRPVSSNDSGANAPDSFLADLSVRLAELGAVQFGSFTLASGIQSPIYIDLRLLVSDPPLLAQVAQAYAQKLAQLSFDRIAGVPYAALPIGTAVAIHTGKPMIYPRKEAKAYGLGKDIEGNWQPGERILVVEDLITSGGSIIKSAERLRDVGLVVEDCVVLIDRDQGGCENLAGAGIRTHSVFQIHDIIHTLTARGHINAETAATVTAFLQESKTS